MSFNVYFQNELLALRERGKEFARRNPALAPFFDTPGSDPDVERLLEGFAFLAGRLRQKLDDEVPEFTHALFNLLWPNYLRPIPASSIIRYQPESTISAPMTIPQGTMVESIPVEGTSCKFRTVYPTEILPLRLAGQRIVAQGEQEYIALQFVTTGVPLENLLPLNALRFYLAGDTIPVHTLYGFLLTKLKSVRCVILPKNDQPRTVAELRPQSVRAVGFHQEDGLYPYSENTLLGYRIIQEYFHFPEKFHFVELTNLDECLNRQILKDAPGATEFEIHFVARKLPEPCRSLQLDNWQLYCTPVVNLFSMHSSPLTLDHRQTEYRIVPEPLLPYHYAIYSVDHVSAWGKNNQSTVQYLPFDSFAHEADPNRTPYYYRLRLSPSSMDGGSEVYISFVQTSKSRTLPQSEAVSLELTCTNRLLPGKLGAGDICLSVAEGTNTVSFKNITPIIPSFQPPLEGGLLWQLLSNMSLNYLSLTNVSALRGILSAYDFRAPHDRSRARVLKKTLNSMVRINSNETIRIYRGMAVRGTRTRLILDERAFSCEGEMYLFSSVLNEFLALYATANSFHQLIVEEATSGEEFIWPVRLGEVNRL